MKKLILLFFLVFTKICVFCQSANYKDFIENQNDYKNPLKICDDTNVIYMKEYYLDNFSIFSEYFKIKDSLWLRIEYNLFNQVVSKGHVIINKRISNDVVLYQNTTPPFNFFLRNKTIFKDFIKIDNWIEIDQINSQVWFGSYLNNKKNGFWELYKVPMNKGEYEKPIKVIKYYNMKL